LPLVSKLRVSILTLRMPLSTMRAARKLSSMRFWSRKTNELTDLCYQTGADQPESGSMDMVQIA
jgi:hypothetical protein